MKFKSIKKIIQNFMAFILKLRSTNLFSNCSLLNKSLSLFQKVKYLMFPLYNIKYIIFYISAIKVLILIIDFSIPTYHAADHNTIIVQQASMHNSQIQTTGYNSINPEVLTPRVDDRSSFFNTFSNTFNTIYNNIWNFVSDHPIIASLCFGTFALGAVYFCYKNGIFFNKSEGGYQEPSGEVLLRDGRSVKVYPVTPRTSPYLGPLNPFEVYTGVAPKTNLGFFEVNIPFDMSCERLLESTGRVTRLSSRAYDNHYYIEVIGSLDKQLLDAGYVKKSLVNMHDYRYIVDEVLGPLDRKRMELDVIGAANTNFMVRRSDIPQIGDFRDHTGYYFDGFKRDFDQLIPIKNRAGDTEWIKFGDASFLTKRSVLIQDLKNTYGKSTIRQIDLSHYWRSLLS